MDDLYDIKFQYNCEFCKINIRYNVRHDHQIQTQYVNFMHLSIFLIFFYNLS
jgi:hypothetical protein